MLALITTGFKNWMMQKIFKKIEESKKEN